MAGGYRGGDAPIAPYPEGKTIAVIMVGGPTKGTRFRPLSLNVAKPLFPLAGQPMVHHPILACKKIPNLAQVFLIGFYEEKEFALYISTLSNELKVPVRYLQEDKPHGSAGGLYKFKDFLMEDDPDDIVVLNCDVCCSFPLREMLDAHRKHEGIGTLLVKKVSKEVASEFGELVADPKTGELLHYAEKPETFVIPLFCLIPMLLLRDLIHFTNKCAGEDGPAICFFHSGIGVEIISVECIIRERPSLDPGHIFSEWYFIFKAVNQEQSL
jgi:hypothetical protein